MDWHPKLAKVVHGNNRGKLHCTDLETLQSTELSGPGGSIAAIRFSPDGKQLAVSRNEGALEILDAETGALIRSIAHLGGWNRRVIAWHNDGQHLAVADGRVIKIVVLPQDTRSPNQLAEAGVCLGHQAELMTLQFHPTYPILASASWDGTTRLWDAKTCDQMIRLPGEFCRFDREGTRLALRCGKSLEYWELTLPTLYRSIDGQTSKAVAIHPNGRIVAIAGLDGVRMWDLLTFAYAGTLPTKSPVDDVAFHPQTGDLMTAGSGGVREWPCVEAPQATGKCLRLGPPREVADGIGVVSKIHWSRDGKVLLLDSAKSGRSYLFDWRTGARSLKVLEQAGMHQMSLCPDGNWTAAGNIKDANRITIWSTSSGKQIRELPIVGALHL